MRKYAPKIVGVTTVDRPSGHATVLWGRDGGSATRHVPMEISHTRWRHVTFERPTAVDMLLQVLTLSIVPLLLAFVYWLPNDYRLALRFTYDDPTLATAISSHFVHMGPAHFASNLVGYVLIVATGYVLAVKSGQRLAYVVAVVTTVLFAPPLLTLLSVVLPQNAIMYGFSGVNLALLGLLPILLVEYARTMLWPTLRPSDAGALYLVACGIIATICAPPSPLTRGITVVAFLSVIGYGVRITGRGLSVRQFCRTLLDTIARGDPLLVAVVVFVGYLFMSFPSSIQHGAVIVNVYLHFVGFAVGFLFWYVATLFGYFDRVRSDHSSRRVPDGSDPVFTTRVPDR